MPKNTPAEFVNRINQATNQALRDVRLKARLAELGVEPMPMTPAEFSSFVASEADKWTRVIRAAGVSAE
jgi:tripartite-type tricarboxylate transporter receptor subunit TctC